MDSTETASIDTTPVSVVTAPITVSPCIKLLQIQESFHDRFPSFKFGSVLNRWLEMPEHFLIKIPYIWKQYEIPRFGVLVYKVTPSIKFHTEFDPFQSEPRDSTMDWSQLYYNYYPPLRNLEKYLQDFFQQSKDFTLPEFNE